MSSRIGIPVFTPGPTITVSWPRYRSPTCAHSGASSGTVDDTIEPRSWFNSHAAQPQQRAERRAELVGRRLPDRRHPPVLDEFVTTVGPEVRLGVADIDHEEHGASMADPSVRLGRRPCGATCDRELFPGPAGAQISWMAASASSVHPSTATKAAAATPVMRE